MTSIKLLIRQLWRNRLFTLLNVLGLTIGISACWIIFRIVNYEFSYDKQHPEKEHIYKLYSAHLQDGQEEYFDGIEAPLPAYIKTNFAQAELTVPIFTQYVERVLYTNGNNKKSEKEDPSDIVATTEEYFQLTPYTWLAGSPQRIFHTQNEVVLTASRAKSYFPNIPFQELLGKTISYDSTTYQIAGVVADLDYPSSFKGKEFIKIADNDWNNTNWLSSSSDYQLYLKVKSPADLKHILMMTNKKIGQMVDKEFSKYGLKVSAKSVSLDELHFAPFMLEHADKKILYGLIAIGGFLLLLACVNYINLTTAQIPQRAKEIGIRKTLGQSQFRIITSFLFETFSITLSAVLLSWPTVFFLQKFGETYLPNGMDTISDHWALLIFLPVLTIFITLLSTIYPIILIQKIKIAEVIKISKASSIKLGKISFRKSLIIFQFLIAQLFVISTFIVGMQLKLALESNLGFQKDAVISIDLPYKSYQTNNTNPFTLKQSLKSIPGIEKIALGQLPLSNQHRGNVLFSKKMNDKNQVNINMKFGDEDYFQLFNFRMLAGRKLQLSDTVTGIVLNLATVEQLGYKNAEEAIGQIVTYNDADRQIVGVTDNFHTKNIHNLMEPVALFASTSSKELKTLNIKLSSNSDTWQPTIMQMEKIWKNYYPKAPFNYTFYDQKLQSYYKSDLRFSRIINLFTTITVLISCLGLIGLVTITTAQRTKEIGIRKVLGSSIFGILRLLSVDYLVLVLISVAVASPLAWWGMHKWLDDFAYKIDIQLWMFILPAAFTLLIALVTISYQSMKAAMANPVDSLRDE